MYSDVAVEPVLCLHKQEEEATEVDVAQHQESTHHREIQYQGNMESYTYALSVMHATVMDILPMNSQINSPNQLILL